MLHYSYILLVLVVCVSSRATDGWFEDCATKTSKMKCRKCCNDQYEIRVAPIQNKARIVSKNWVNKLTTSYCAEDTKLS